MSVQQNRRNVQLSFGFYCPGIAEPGYRLQHTPVDCNIKIYIFLHCRYCFHSKKNIVVMLFHLRQLIGNLFCKLVGKKCCLRLLSSCSRSTLHRNSYLVLRNVVIIQKLFPTYLVMTATH